MTFKSQVIPTKIYMSIKFSNESYRTYPYNPQNGHIYHQMGVDKTAAHTARGYEESYFWEAPSDDFKQWEFLQKVAHKDASALKTSLSGLGFKAKSYEDLHNG